MKCCTLDFAKKYKNIETGLCYKYESIQILTQIIDCYMYSCKEGRKYHYYNHSGHYGAPRRWDTGVQQFRILPPAPVNFRSQPSMAASAGTNLPPRPPCVKWQQAQAYEASVTSSCFQNLPPLPFSVTGCK